MDMLPPRPPLRRDADRRVVEALTREVAQQAVRKERLAILKEMQRMIWDPMSEDALVSGLGRLGQWLVAREITDGGGWFGPELNPFRKECI